MFTLHKNKKAESGCLWNPNSFLTTHFHKNTTFTRNWELLNVGLNKMTVCG